MASIINLLKLGIKDLIGQKKMYLFLVLNFLTGTFGFLLVQFFQGSLRLDLERRASEMLGADYTIASNRVLSDDQVRFFEKR